MWVDNDYKGFGEDGVRKSWEWSRQWLNELRPVDPSEGVFSSKGSYNGKANGSGNGPDYFHEQLEYFGLPTDPASEIEHKNKAEEKAAINAMYVGPGKAKPVIPAKNAPKSQIKTSMYSVQGQNLTNAGSNSTIEKTAQSNFANLKGALGNADRNSNRERGESLSSSEELRRIEALYGESEVTRGEDRKLLCDTIRRAGGVAQRKVNEDYEVDAISQDFLTKEMLLARKANLEHGYETVFYVGWPRDFIGDYEGLNGFADTDSNVAYVRADAKNGRSSSVTKKVLPTKRLSESFRASYRSDRPPGMKDFIYSRTATAQPLSPFWTM